MVQEPEVIRRQMEVTRMALTDKIELLERQVVGTVMDTSSAVVKTVTVAKDGVEEVVQMVKNSVHDTVAVVQESFDLPRQVARRPWTMVGGATALGFLGGYLLQGSRPRQPRQSNGRADDADFAVARRMELTSLASSGHTNGKSTAAAAPTEPTMLDNFGKTFEKEISQLKGLAVGTLFGILRDVVMPSVPEPLERQVEEVIDGVTEKLGGKPIRGPILPVRAETENFTKNQPVSPGQVNGSHRFQSVGRE